MDEPRSGLLIVSPAQAEPLGLSFMTCRSVWQKVGLVDDKRGQKPLLLAGGHGNTE